VVTGTGSKVTYFPAEDLPIANAYQGAGIPGLPRDGLDRDAGRDPSARGSGLHKSGQWLIWPSPLLRWGGVPVPLPPARASSSTTSTNSARCTARALRS
jgi:hypothetical protein